MGYNQVLRRPDRDFVLDRAVHLGPSPIATLERSDCICSKIWYEVVALHYEVAIGYTSNPMRGADADRVESVNRPLADEVWVAPS